MGEEKAPERLRLVEPERSPEEKSAALMPSAMPSGAWCLDRRSQ